MLIWKSRIRRECIKTLSIYILFLSNKLYLAELPINATIKLAFFWKIVITSESQVSRYNEHWYSRFGMEIIYRTYTDEMLYFPKSSTPQIIKMKDLNMARFINISDINFSLILDEACIGSYIPKIEKCNLVFLVYRFQPTFWLIIESCTMRSFKWSTYTSSANIYLSSSHSERWRSIKSLWIINNAREIGVGVNNLVNTVDSV